MWWPKSPNISKKIPLCQLESESSQSTLSIYSAKSIGELLVQTLNWPSLAQPAQIDTKMYKYQAFMRILWDYQLSGVLELRI